MREGGSGASYGREGLTGGGLGWVLPGASIDMNFAQGLYFGTALSGLTVSRASTGMACDASGYWYTFGSNVPRITNQGLLVEEARTNLLLHSSSLTNGAWGYNNLVVTGGQPSPDGGTNASYLTPTATNINHNGYNLTGITASAATYTASMFFKAGAYDFAWLEISSPASTGYTVVVNLATGAVTSTNSVGSPTNTASSVVVYPNRWVCVAVTMTCVATANATFVSYGASSSGTPSFAVSGNPTFLGDGVSGVYAWQPQLELNPSTVGYATSPIPTSGSAVTRAADIVSFNQTFGSAYSVYASGLPQAAVTYTSNQMWVSVDDGTTNNRINLFKTAASGIASMEGVAGGTQYFTGSTGAVFAVGTLGKMAMSAAVNNQNLMSNEGGVLTTNATGTPATPTKIHIGSRADLTLQANTYIQRIAVWPLTALNATQLTTLTSGSGP